MKRNKYLSEAFEFVKKASASMASDMLEDNYISTIIYFSFGMEKLLKGIIYNINPCYIYTNDSFDSTYCNLYNSKLIKKDTKNYNNDLISFRTCIKRASYFSKTTCKYQNYLHKLASFRDIIAHRTCDEIDIKEIDQMFKAEYYNP